MCYTNTALRIKVLVAVCVCINAFNFVYMSMRYADMLPEEQDYPVQLLYKLLPPVNNLDKYMQPKTGAVLIGGLAGISILFDAALYVGVERGTPSLVSAAWTWGILHSASDFTIGVAAANMSFTDSLARANVTSSSEHTPIHVSPYPPRQRAGNAEEDVNEEEPACTDPPDPLLAEVREGPPRKDVPDADEENGRLSPAKLAGLLLYVVFRLIIQAIALAGIRNYVGTMRETAKARDVDIACPCCVKLPRIPESTGSCIEVPSVVQRPPRSSFFKYMPAFLSPSRPEYEPPPPPMYDYEPPLHQPWYDAHPRPLHAPPSPRHQPPPPYEPPAPGHRMPPPSGFNPASPGFKPVSSGYQSGPASVQQQDFRQLLSQGYGSAPSPNIVPQGKRGVGLRATERPPTPPAPGLARPHKLWLSERSASGFLPLH